MRPDITVASLYILFLGFSFLYWQLEYSTPWIVFSTFALCAKVIVGSLKEGEIYWPRIEIDKTPYSTARLTFHVLIIIGITVSACLLFVGEDEQTWQNGELPIRWKWSFLATALLYGLSSVPSIMALSNSKLWENDGLNRTKRMISISVIKEIVTAGFLVPLIYGATDIVNDNDDSEWRAYASSLVFTNAVIYFIVFWYVTDWNKSSPLEDDKVVSRICRACGMFAIYVVVIRRLHLNRVIMHMRFVSEKDNIALVGAFLFIGAGYLIRLKEHGVVHVPTVAIVSSIFLILFLLFITINI